MSITNGDFVPDDEREACACAGGAEAVHAPGEGRCDPVFCHHLYEYEKGLRDLILHTTDAALMTLILHRLKRRGVAYQIYRLDNGRVNVFFGSADCVAIVRGFAKKNLSDYTPEEDFILGIMLGYSRQKQFQRYLKFKGRLSGAGIGLPALAA